MSNKQIFNLPEISPDVLSIVEGLLNAYQARLKASKVLELDLEWPSLGIIDLLSFGLRYRHKPTPDHEQLFRQLSSYLAVWVSKTWTSLGIKNSVEIDNSNFVIIKDLNQNWVLEIEKLFRDVLIFLPSPLPIFDNYQHYYAGDSNIVSVWSLGVVMGLSPILSNSPNRKLNEDDKKTLKNRFERELAKQTSRWFARVFPDQQLIQVSEFYLNGQILPPYLYSDKPPLEHAVTGIYSYFNKLGLSEMYLINAVRAFAFCPDDQIALLSVVLAGIFGSIEKLPVEIIACSKVKAKSVVLCRTAFNSVRPNNVGAKDWLNVGLSVESLDRFRMERELGYLPWLILSENRLLSSENKDQVREIILHLVSYEFDKASALINNYVQQNPADIELRLQQIKLQMLGGDLDRAHESCKSLLSEPESDNFPLLYNLWGTCLLEKNEPEVALRYFKAARAVVENYPIIKSEVINNLAWSYIQLDKFDIASELLQEAEVFSNCPVTILLNRAYLAGLKNDIELRKKILSKLITQAPFDRRVFACVMSQA